MNTNDVFLVGRRVDPARARSLDMLRTSADI